MRGSGRFKGTSDGMVKHSRVGYRRKSPYYPWASKSGRRELWSELGGRKAA